MKKLVLLLAISSIISCKKEKPVEPTPQHPIIAQPPVKLTGSVVFYEKTKVGTMYVEVDTVAIGSIAMCPSNWIPTCSTIGWCVKYTNTGGVTHSYKATITGNGTPFVKVGSFHLTNGGCLSIAI